MLSDLFEWKNTCFPYEDYLTFNLDEMTESECLERLTGEREVAGSIPGAGLILRVLK